MSGTGEWRTPSPLYAHHDRRFLFDYDPCATHENRLVKWRLFGASIYSTLDGTFEFSFANAPDGTTPGYRQISDLDGLRYDWTGRRVFMNPVYSRGEIARWVEKARDEMHRAALIVALLPADASTLWWQRFVGPYADITYLPKRVRFVHPPEPCGPKCRHEMNEPVTGAPGGHVIAIYHDPRGLAKALAA